MLLKNNNVVKSQTIYIAHAYCPLFISCRSLQKSRLYLNFHHRWKMLQQNGKHFSKPCVESLQPEYKMTCHTLNPHLQPLNPPLVEIHRLYPQNRITCALKFECSSDCRMFHSVNRSTWLRGNLPLTSPTLDAPLVTSLLFTFSFF